MDISEEAFCVEIYKKKTDPNPTTSIKHRAFYSNRKNPFSVATLLGDKTSEIVVIKESQRILYAAL